MWVVCSMSYVLVWACGRIVPPDPAPPPPFSSAPHRIASRRLCQWRYRDQDAPTATTPQNQSMIGTCVPILSPTCLPSYLPTCLRTCLTDQHTTYLPNWPLTHPPTHPLGPRDRLMAAVSSLLLSRAGPVLPWTFMERAQISDEASAPLSHH